MEIETGQQAEMVPHFHVAADSSSYSSDSDSDSSYNYFDTF